MLAPITQITCRNTLAGGNWKVHAKLMTVTSSSTRKSPRLSRKAEAAARKELRKIADLDTQAASDARAILARRRNSILAVFRDAKVGVRETSTGYTDFDLDEVTDLDKVLPIADVVMMLRIQFERHGEGAPTNNAAPKTIASIREYREFYGMTDERAARLRKNAIVLHPGPMNRGIEIDASVADGPRSHILRQVSHGVLVRMAVLEAAVT